MSQHIERLIDNGENAQRHFRDRAASLDERMATWALVGNGAGLLLCFNGLVDHKICNWSVIEPIAQLFFLGIVSAFAKVVFAQRVVNDAERTMIFLTSSSRIAASLVEAKRLALEAGVPNELSEQYDAAIARIAELQKPTVLGQWLDRGSSWVLAISVLCFGGAIFWAISSDIAPTTVCAAG